MWGDTEHFGVHVIMCLWALEFSVEVRAMCLLHFLNLVQLFKHHLAQADKRFVLLPSQ